MHEYWLDGFVLWLKAQRRTPQTVKRYAYDARCFLKTVGDRQITRRVINEHMESFGDFSRAYHRNSYNGVKSFLSYLREEEELDVPDMPGKAPEVKLPRIDVPTEDDIRKLLAGCRHKNLRYGLRDETIIRVLASTGMRRSECAGIKVSDLDLGPMPRVLVMGKGEKPRYAPLSAKATLKVRRYRKEREKHPYASSPMLWLGDHGPLTPKGINALMERASERAGVDIHPHQLRHSFCHEFQVGGGQVNEMAHIVGWESLAMAMRYARATLGDRAEERARALAIGDRL